MNKYKFMENILKVYYLSEVKKMKLFAGKGIKNIMEKRIV